MTSECLTWQIREQRTIVHFHTDAVDELRQLISSSGSSEEKAEIGGLLLGRVASEKGRHIHIEGLTPIACGHGQDAFYHLSPEERTTLRDKIALWRPGPGKRLHVVGYYRSHHREEWLLDPEDLVIAKDCFPAPPSVLMLVKPSADRAQADMGGFFLSRGAQIEAEPSLLFPFNLSQPAAAEAGFNAASPAFSPEDLAKAATIPEAADPIQSQVVADPQLSSLADPGYSREELLAEIDEDLDQIAAEITREARRQHGRKTPAVVGVIRGILEVGYKSAWARAVCLLVLLTVLGLVGYRTRHREAVQTKTSEPHGEERAQTRASGLLRLSVPDQSPPKVSVSKQSLPFPQNDAKGAPVLGAKRVAPPAEQQEATPLALRREQPEPLLLTLPAMGSALPDSRLTGLIENRFVPPQATTAPVAQAIVPQSSVSFPGFAETPPSPPPQDSVPETFSDGSAKTIEYIAPRPLRSVAPFLPSSLRRLAVDNVRIEVAVHIDATGKVIQAEPLSTGNSLIEYLSGIAVDAARQWRFSPARRGSQNVLSKTVLRFQFDSGTRMADGR